MRKLIPFIIGLLCTVQALAADPLAKRVRIQDAGSYYTGTQVEAALQEIGAGTTLDSRYLQISNNLSDLNNVGTARTNLGLVAGGTGDIWVEKAGDTMSGTLNMDGNNITNIGTLGADITDLDDVTITSGTQYDLLQLNGSGEWVNDTLANIADGRYYTEML